MAGLRVSDFNGRPLDWQQRLLSAGQQAARPNESALTARAPVAGGHATDRAVDMARTEGAVPGTPGHPTGAADEARADKLQRFRALVESGQPVDLPKLADALTRAGVLPVSSEE
ncbi:MAG: hypothetical protein K6T31_09240 [Alicyclobacillus sp.]|nr:hypothetical protein [Alicyclobacillus sp.]